MNRISYQLLDIRSQTKKSLTTVYSLLTSRSGFTLIFAQRIHRLRDISRCDIRLLRSDRRSCQGFTLIELLVSVSIIIAVAAIALPRLNIFKDTQDLDSEANKVLSAIKETQSNALSGHLCGDSFKPTQKADEWYLQANTSNVKVEPSCASNPALPTKTFNFENTVVLDKAYFDSGNRSSDPRGGVELSAISQTVASGGRVRFKNISGEIVFNNNSGAQILNVSRMIIVLTSPITGTKIGVFIEKGGLVYLGLVR